MHAVKEGPANRSFGLQVAALAGLPKSVIAQARRYLNALERAGTPHDVYAAPTFEPSPQLGLFTPSTPSAVDEALRALEPDVNDAKGSTGSLVSTEITAGIANHNRQDAR